MSIGRITDLPLERVSEENHKLGWVDDDGNGCATSRIKRVRKGADNPDATPPESAHLLHPPFSPSTDKGELDAGMLALALANGAPCSGPANTIETLVAAAVALVVFTNAGER